MKHKKDEFLLKKGVYPEDLDHVIRAIEFWGTKPSGVFIDELIPPEKRKRANGARRSLILKFN